VKPAPRYRNEAVLSKLKKARGAPIRIPSQIQFRLADDRCEIYMPADVVCTNLQQDPAAFEGWVLVLKAWLDCSVSLNWEPPVDPMDEHYQRFLYRVIRFNEAVDWFTIYESSMQYLADSLVLNPDGSPKKPQGYFLINAPGKRKDVEVPHRVKTINEMSENELERLISIKSRSLQYSVGLTKDTQVLRQIPVGIFAKKISRNTRVFPGLGGRIDLGAIDDAKGVWLFELKKPGNNKVGVISELLFYSHVIRDVQLGVFVYDEKRKGQNERRLCEAKNIGSFILADRLNGSIDKAALFELLNTAFAKRNERFGYIKYQSAGNSVRCKKIY